MNAQDIVCRLCEDAMSRHGMQTLRELANRIGCGEKTARKLLHSEEAHLNQEQFLTLLKLGGINLWTK